MKKTKEKPKMYVIKKYIKASCASEAISFDSKTPVHDVWVDSDWAKNELAGAIGFTSEPPHDEV